MSILSRENHQYAPPGKERVTPIDEIPVHFQKVVRLSEKKVQTLDIRLCYNWEPGEDGGRYVECGSVASDADKF